MRTDPDVPKHRGLTMLIIPLRAPGVTSVPIRQINGQAEFCEVFFDDVAVPVENVVGAINDGWTVASNLLMHERSAAGQTRKADVTADLVALARQRGKADDPAARQLIAQVHERASVEPELLARISAEMRAGEKPSTAGSLVKLFRAQKAQFAGHAGMRIAGPHGVAWPRRRAGWRALERRLPQQPGPLDRGRHQRDAAQHHQRACAGPAPGGAARPRRPLQPGPLEQPAEPPGGAGGFLRARSVRARGGRRGSRP